MNDDTRELVRQWKAKAQNDWTAVEILSTNEQCPADAVCFHCQQFVEKLLKAFLTYHDIEVPKTHDLRRLIQLAEPFEPELSQLSDSSDKLTVHGVDTRYPGDCYPITSEEMNEVIEISKQFSNILLPKLEQ